MTQKTSSLKDIRKLHEQLQQQLDETDRNELRNSAKIRAISTAKSYEEFRQIVNAAHLQPIRRKSRYHFN